MASLSADIGVRPIGGVGTVRSYLNDCLVCKLLRKTRAEQLMAPLPDYRIRPREAVFTSVAINYAGPYEIKRGRSVEKCWACIFLCNVTSAVRIELIELLKTKAFLNYLKHFLSLTGNNTRHIRNDHATTFVGANNVWSKEAIKTLWDKQILQMLTNR